MVLGKAKAKQIDRKEDRKDKRGQEKMSQSTESRAEQSVESSERDGKGCQRYKMVRNQSACGGEGVVV